MISNPHQSMTTHHNPQIDPFVVVVDAIMAIHSCRVMLIAFPLVTFIFALPRPPRPLALSHQMTMTASRPLSSPRPTTR